MRLPVDTAAAAAAAAEEGPLPMANAGKHFNAYLIHKYNINFTVLSLPLVQCIGINAISSEISCSGSTAEDEQGIGAFITLAVQGSLSERGFKGAVILPCQCHYWHFMAVNHTLFVEGVH